MSESEHKQDEQPNDVIRQPLEELPEPAVAPTPERAEAAAEPDRGGRGIAVVALLLALGALGGGYGLWTQLEQLRTADSRDSQAMQGRVQQLAAQQQEVAARLDKTDIALNETRADTQLLGEALEKMSERLGRDRHGWVLAEAEYLLQVGNRRLLLERDVAGAVEALAAADRRLADLNDPALTRVRVLISEELQALRALPTLDVAGIALELGALSKAVDDLVLAGIPRAASPDEAATVDEEGGWRKMLRAVWSDIRGLVVVRRHEADGPPLTTPDQRLLLRQNLRLKLETARLALLRGHNPVYRAALQEADEWVGRFYDAEAATTVAMREALGRLAAIDIATALPPIEQSLHALREANERPERSGRP